jgi:hypothetical protein
MRQCWNSEKWVTYSITSPLRCDATPVAMGMGGGADNARIVRFFSCMHSSSNLPLVPAMNGEPTSQAIISGGGSKEGRASGYLDKERRSLLAAVVASCWGGCVDGPRPRARWVVGGSTELGEAPCVWETCGVASRESWGCAGWRWRRLREHIKETPREDETVLG